MFVDYVLKDDFYQWNLLLKINQKLLFTLKQIIEIMSKKICP